MTLTGVNAGQGVNYMNTGEKNTVQNYNNESNITSTFGYGFKSQGGEHDITYVKDDVLDNNEHNLPEVVVNGKKDSKFNKILKHTALNLIPGYSLYDNYIQIRKTVNIIGNTKVKHHEDGSKTKISPILDSKGKVIGRIETIVGFDKKPVSAKEYNKENTLTSEVFYNDKKGIDARKEYNIQGTMSKLIEYNSDGKISSVVEFDEKEKPITEIVCDKNGKPVEQKNYEYNEKGMRTSKCVYNKDGQLTIKYTYEYEKVNTDEADDCIGVRIGDKWEYYIQRITKTDVINNKTEICYDDEDG